MTETYMTIREMCDAFEVTPRTLRFYEAKELLFPIRERCAFTNQKKCCSRNAEARAAFLRERIAPG